MIVKLVLHTTFGLTRWVPRKIHNLIDFVYFFTWKRFRIRRKYVFICFLLGSVVVIKDHIIKKSKFQMQYNFGDVLNIITLKSKSGLQLHTFVCGGPPCCCKCGWEGAEGAEEDEEVL